MKTIDIKKSINITFDNMQYMEKIQKNVKIVTNVKNNSTKEKNKNNLSLLVDSVVSVVDAFSSVYRYLGAVEVTKQLELILETKKKELSNLKEIYNELLKTYKLEFEMKLKTINAKIANDKKKSQLRLLIYRQTGEILEMLNEQLYDVKRNYLSNDEIIKLEKKYIETLHTRLMMSLELIE